MNVADERIATIDYTLTNAAGEVIESSADGEPLAYLHGAGDLIPGLESALVGKSAGDRVQVEVLPALAYGDRDDALQRSVPKKDLVELGDDIEPGLDTNVFPTCKGCGGDNKLALPFTAEFFRPTRLHPGDA